MSEIEGKIKQVKQEYIEKINLLTMLHQEKEQLIIELRHRVELIRSFYQNRASSNLLIDYLEKVGMIDVLVLQVEHQHDELQELYRVFEERLDIIGSLEDEVHE